MSPLSFKLRSLESGLRLRSADDGPMDSLLPNWVHQTLRRGCGRNVVARRQISPILCRSAPDFDPVPTTSGNSLQRPSPRSGTNRRNRPNTNVAITTTSGRSNTQPFRVIFPNRDQPLPGRFLALYDLSKSSFPPEMPDGAGQRETAGIRRTLSALQFQQVRWSRIDHRFTGSGSVAVARRYRVHMILPLEVI